MTKSLGGAGGGGSPTIVKDSVRSQDSIEFVLGICEGPIAGLIEGPKSFYLGDTPLTSQTGEDNFETFEVHMYHGAADPTRIVPVFGGSSTNTQVNGGELVRYVPQTRTTPSAIAGQIDRLEVRLAFSQLLKTTNDGDQLQTTASYRIQYKREDEVTWRDFVGRGYNGVDLSWVISADYFQEEGGSTKGYDISSTKNPGGLTGNLKNLANMPISSMGLSGATTDTSRAAFNRKKVVTYGTIWYHNVNCDYEYVVNTAVVDAVSESAVEALNFTFNCTGYSNCQAKLNITAMSPGFLSITAKTGSTYIKEYVRRIPDADKDYGGNWMIRVEKLTTEDDDNIFCTMAWESFQCISTSSDLKFENLAVVRGLGSSSNQFSSLPQISGIYAGKLVKIPNNYNPVTRVYTGVWNGTFVLGYTDNPAWCLYDLIMDEKYGFKYHIPNIQADRYSFYEAAQWCDVLVPRTGTTGYQPRYTYHDLMDQQRNAIEAGQYIASIFGGILTTDLNGTVRLKLDKPGNPVQIFGPESVTIEGFQYQFADMTSRVNDMTVTFINPDLNWNQDVRRVALPDLISANGRIPMDFVAVGCLDPYEAQRRAQLRLLSANTEVTTVTFSTARPGILLEPFDIIGITDPYMNWGMSGRVKSKTDYTINLRDSLYLTANGVYTLTLQTATGPETYTVKNGVSPVSNALTIMDGYKTASVRRNLLSYTGTFSNAVWAGYWAKPTFTTGHTAPDGTATAISWNTSTTLGSPLADKGGFLFLAPAGDAGKTATASVWLRASAPVTLTLGPSDATVVNINVTTEWQRFSCTGLISAVMPRYFQIYDVTNADVDVFMWGPQSELGSVMTATQQVTDATTVLEPITIPEKSQFALSSSTIGLVKPFRVLSIAEDTGTDDKFTITAIEINTNKYGDADNMSATGTVQYAFEDSMIPKVPRTIKIQSGTNHLYRASSGQIESRIWLSWEQDPTTYLEEFEIYYRRIDRDSWTKVVATDQDAYLTGVQDGMTYQIYLRAVNAIGKKSPPTAIYTHTVVGKTAAPSNVTAAVTTQVGSDVRIDWTPITDLDLSYYEIRLGGTSWETATRIGTSKTDVFTHTNVVGLTLVYRIKAVDTTGNYSTAAFSITHTTAIPLVPTISAALSGPNYVIRVTPASGDVIPVKEYVYKVNGAEVFRGAATSYTARVNWTGLKTFAVSAVNSAGQLSSEVTTTLTVASPAAVSVTDIFSETNYILSWNAPSASLPIDHYVVNNKTGNLILDDDLRATTYIIPVDWLGSRQFEVWAVDTAGNAGPVSIVTGATALPQVTNLQSRLFQSQLQLSWTGQRTSLPIKQYRIYNGLTFASATLMLLGLPGEIQDGVQVATVDAQNWSTPIDWNGTQFYYVVAEDVKGNLSIPAIVAETVDPPEVVSVTNVIVDKSIRLQWSEPVSELRIREYEIWRDGTLVQKVSATTALVPINFAGTKTYSVRAIDEAGNAGVFGSSSVVITAPASFTFNADIVGDQVKLSWETPTSTLAIAEYVLTRGVSNTLITRLTANSFTQRVDWAGDETFKITAYDIAGNASATQLKTLTITAPSAPSVRPEVLDNNVMLRWTNGSGTLPIAGTEIRRGTTFATATVMQQVDATFATFFEFYSGSYTYWLVHIDAAGNYGTPVSNVMTVSQPPDFILQADFDSTFSGTKTLTTLYQNKLYFGVDTAQTYQAHFTGNGFSTPQDQITAGYPLFLQPVEAGSASYQEIFDYGAVLASSLVTVTPTTEILAGNPSILVDIESRALATDPWTSVAVGANQGFASNFRYIRFTLRLIKDSRDDLLAVNRINVRLNSKLRTDSGTGSALSTDATGTPVVFAVQFVDVQSISVTPLGTTAKVAVYDFVDVAYPTQFKVYLFDTSGNRVSGNFSWSARGF